MNILKTNERFEERNREYCKISEEAYKTRRDQYAIELRKSKRHSYYAEKRAQLRDISDTLFSDYTGEMQLEQVINILKYNSEEDLKFRAIEVVRSTLMKYKNIPPYLDLIRTLKDCLAEDISDFLAGMIALLLGDLANFEPYAIEIAYQDIPYFLISYLSETKLVYTQYALTSLLNMSEFARNDILRHFDKISWLLYAKIIQNHTEILDAISELILDLNKAQSLQIYNHQYITVVCCFLMESTDYEVLRKTLHAISYMSKENDRNIQTLIKSNLIKDSLHLLKYKDLQNPILQTVGNITYSKNLSFTDHLLDEGLLDLLVDLIMSYDIDIIEKKYKIISNVVAGSEQHRDRFRKHRIFELCIQGLSAVEEQCRFEASYILYIYVLSTSAQNIIKLLDFDILIYLKDFAGSQNPLFVKYALTIFLKLFQASYYYQGLSDKFIEIGHRDEVEALQYSRDPHISLLASQIIESYFS